MGVVHNPHDKFFKATMSNLQVARDFFQQNLSEFYRSYIDFNTLELQPGSYIDKNLNLSVSDVLYKVQFLENYNYAYLYVLAEHQSSVDNLMPFRLWQYIVAIWNEHLKKNKGDMLPLVIPLVFYNGRKPYDGTRDIRELIDAPKELVEQFLLKAFHLIDTHDIEDEELRKQHWSGLMEFVMKHVYEKETLDYIQVFLDLFKQIAKHKGSDEFLKTVLKYYLSQAETTDPGRFKKALELGLSDSKEGEIMGTLANYFIEQGAQKGEILGMQKGEVLGMQKGEVLGMQKGESFILMHLLERKFGDIPSQYLEKIQNADSNTLLCWAEKILEADNIEFIFQ